MPLDLHQDLAPTVALQAKNLPTPALECRLSDLQSASDADPHRSHLTADNQHSGHFKYTSQRNEVKVAPSTS